MKRAHLVWVVAAFVVLALSTVPARAQTANFEGSTLGFSKNGDFRDNGSTCPGGSSPTAYQWTFVEDGTTQTGNPVTHKFVTSFCGYTVQLKITCSGGSTATKTRPVCFGCGVPGCIDPDTGYN
jgi:hypothetical protein